MTVAGPLSVSLSGPFIERPVATALLMAAVLLTGIVAYTQLPVSALPQVDYPTIQVLTFYPGASPDVMATTVTAPLERQFGQMQGLNQMTSTSAGGVSVIVLQFALTSISTSPNRRCRRRSTQRRVSADEPADAAGLQQDQPRRRAGPDAGDHVESRCRSPRSKTSWNAPGAQALAVERRGPGEHQRRPKAGGAHPGESGGVVVVRHHARRPADRPRRRPGQRRQGQVRRPASGLPDQRQRSAPRPATTTARWSSPTERLAGPARGRRDRRRRGREHETGGVDE